MDDKAIRSAKLTLGGMLEKRRAKSAVERAQGQIAPSKYLPGVPRQVHADGGKVAFMQDNHPDMTYADGGRIHANGGGKMNKHGMYSKAAKLIRALPQERGTAEQMIAAARLKDTPEFKNFGPLPTGKTTREDLARAFESRIPGVRVDQYGENPSYLSRAERNEYNALKNNPQNIPLMPFEEKRLAELHARTMGAAPVNVETHEDDDGNEEPRDFQYEDYKTPGGLNYRERLLRLTQSEHPAAQLNRNIANYQRQLEYEAPIYGGMDHPIMQSKNQRLQELIAERDRALQEHGPLRDKSQSYQSSHWRDHPDVLAHIRMQDRTVGNRRLLHVEELQSDWAQEGRDKGFHDPEKPFQLFDWDKNKALSNHATEDEARAVGEAMGPEATVSIRNMNTGNQKFPPAAPYVQNTQHWTDLALKHVLREAALGNYDGVVFTPGQAQADRYGLEKTVSAIHYDPQKKILKAERHDGGSPIMQSDVEPGQVASHIGKEAAEKLLHPSNAYTVNGVAKYSLVGDDLKVGGQGMKGYYDQIVPKSVTRLAQMHDPDIRPAEPISMKGDDGNEYQGFHLPMTPKLKQGILNEGYPAFRRGGSVDAALAATSRFTKDGQHVTMRLKD